MVPALVVLFSAPAELKFNPLIVCVVAVVKVRAPVVNLMALVVPAAAEVALIVPPVIFIPFVVPPVLVAINWLTDTLNPSAVMLVPETPVVTTGLVRLTPAQLIVPAVPVLFRPPCYV